MDSLLKLCYFPSNSREVSQANSLKLNTTVLSVTDKMIYSEPESKQMYLMKQKDNLDIQCLHSTSAFSSAQRWHGLFPRQNRSFSFHQNKGSVFFLCYLFSKTCRPSHLQLQPHKVISSTYQRSKTSNFLLSMKLQLCKPG